MIAPTFLIRCARCLVFHPWRKASRETAPVDRLAPHKCPHGFACGARSCIHGRLYSEIRVQETENGTRVLGCNGADPCIDTTPLCPQCTEARAVFAKSQPQEKCIVCAEVNRQGGSGCPRWKTSTVNGWTYHKQDGLCKWQSSETVPPWCAGATEDERALFIAALPGEKRDVAILEAQKANFQEGAKQETEAPKRVAKKRGAGQASMF